MTLATGQTETRTYNTTGGRRRSHVIHRNTHVALGVHTVTAMIANPLDAELDLPDAAAYFERVREAFGAATVACTAVRFAATTRTQARVELFGKGAGETLTAAARLPADTVVASLAGPIRLGSYLQTRILEATVHLLDLQHALGITDPVSAPALERTVQILQQLTPATAFIELATGRSNAVVFPVLT